VSSVVTLAWEAPNIDFHAFAPEIVVLVGFVLLVLFDLFAGERNKWIQSSLAGITLLVAVIPIVTLAADGADRVMFGGAFVVDDFALVLQGLFVATAYVVVLLSTNYLAEGDYWEGEYYQLLLASVLGMMVMASARDLITIFVALELLSIPAYMLAAWRKRDLKSNEAGLKYYLMGVFATAVMLYGMSLLYGVTGSTLLTEIGAAISAFPGAGG
jgi:NADH-quinone oxidoreductase subunit N